MNTASRASKPTPEDISAAQRLRNHWEARGRNPSQAQLANALGITQGAVNHYLRGRNKISFKTLVLLCRELGIDPSAIRTDLPEQQLPPPQADASAGHVSIAATETHGAYVRVSQLDATAAMGEGVINSDYPEIIGSIDIAASYLRNVFGYVPPAGRLRIITGRGESMAPKIMPGDTLIVDTGITAYQGDGIYLINSGHGQQIKQLQDRGDALYVCSVNPDYPAFPAPRSLVIGGRVCVKSRFERLE
jgi:phage repressor protein C with HTH and peptisase S24 domain